MPEEIQCISWSPSTGFCRVCLIPESDASKRPWRWMRGQALTLLIELCQGPNLQNQELNSCTAKWLGDVSARQQLWAQVVINMFSARFTLAWLAELSRTAAGRHRKWWALWAWWRPVRDSCSPDLNWSASLKVRRLGWETQLEGGEGWDWREKVGEDDTGKEKPGKEGAVEFWVKGGATFLCWLLLLQASLAIQYSPMSNSFMLTLFFWPSASPASMCKACHIIEFPSLSTGSMRLALWPPEATFTLQRSDDWNLCWWMACWPW